MTYLIRLAVLWLPFSLTALLAIVGLPFILLLNREWGKDILRAMDKLGASVLGYSGVYTLSAECGKSECKPCKFMCAFLDLIDYNHCAKAAKKEGVV